MKPISKYRRKVLAREPETLLGQRLAEALKRERPDAANIEPFNFVITQHRNYEYELCDPA